MSKIFKIKVEVELCFYGSEPPEDAELADAVKSEIEMEQARVRATEVIHVSEVDKEWRDVYPHGEDGGRYTVAEWLELLAGDSPGYGNDDEDESDRHD